MHPQIAHELCPVKAESIHRPPDARLSTNKTAPRQSVEGVKNRSTEMRIVFNMAFYPRPSHNAPLKYLFQKLNLSPYDGHTRKLPPTRPAAEHHRTKWTRVSTLKILNLLPRVGSVADLCPIGAARERDLWWVGEVVAGQVWRVWRIVLLMIWNGNLVKVTLIFP